MTDVPAYDPDQGDDTVVEQLDDADTLDGRGWDPLDEGVSPVEAPWGSGAWGVTVEQQRSCEPLAARLRREDVERPDDGGDGLGDLEGSDGELRDVEVGDRRSGRLVLRDEADVDYADDVGVDGAGASAEESAMHVIGNEEP